MTKNEAIKAMRNGSKVTHKYFRPDEWMCEVGSLYKFEDGCQCFQYEFWKHRNHDSWLDGWEIYNGNHEK